MRTLRSIATVAAVLALAACVTETKESRSLVWRDGDPAPAGATRADAPPESPQATRSRTPADGEVVSIPEEVMARLMKFVNGPKMVIGDRIEIDATRIPFQVAMVPLADPDLVEVTELSAPKLKAMGIVMRSRAELPVVEGDFCHLRLGDGVDIVGSREIVTRTYNEVDPDRPAFLTLKASGHAVYKDLRTGERREASTIVLRIEIVKENGRLVYRESIR